MYISNYKFRKVSIFINEVSAGNGHVSPPNRFVNRKLNIFFVNPLPLKGGSKSIMICGNITSRLLKVNYSKKNRQEKKFFQRNKYQRILHV